MVYVFLADGFEEIEAVTVVDVLRRAGLNVKTVGVPEQVVKGAHGIKFVADILLKNAKFDQLESIVLPGGMPGAENLLANEGVVKFVNFCAKSNKLIAAICAAPMILGKLGLLKGKKAVCYPGFEGELLGANIDKNSVCLCENMLTAKGPGTALEFSLKIVSYLAGDDIARSVKKSLVM